MLTYRRSGWMPCCCLLFGILAPSTKAQYVFWSLADGTIMRSDLEGNSPIPIIATDPINAMVVDPVEHELYIVQPERIRRLAFDGSGVMIVLEAPFDEIAGLALDPYERHLYFSQVDRLRRFDLNNETFDDIYNNLTVGHIDLNLPGGELFITRPVDTVNNSVFRVKLDPIDDSFFATGRYYEFAIDSFHGWLFIIRTPDAVSSTIYRSSLKSFDAQGLLARPIIESLAVDPLGGKLYWTEPEAGRIMRMNLDATGSQVVIAGQVSPGSIAVFNPTDCNGNSIEDWCDYSCGSPGGACDVPGCGGQPDCDLNGFLDVCEGPTDCNQNGTNDRCELHDGSAQDCNDNFLPDDCDVAKLDCNSNSIPDDCDVATGGSPDCNHNLAPDDCDIAGGVSEDLDDNDVPDECCPPPCVPDPLAANSFGTCTMGAYRECDVDAQDCPAANGICERCGQVRYISFGIPENNYTTAIRIRLDSLYHPTAPPQGAPPSFALIEGQDRYLNTIPGAVSQCCDPNSNPTVCQTSANCTSDADCVTPGYTKCEKNLCPDVTWAGRYFRCARVGCNPEYRDWSDFAGLPTYATGDSVIPSSSYNLFHLAPSCVGNEEACAAASPPLMITTERWANVDCSNVNNGNPGATDIGWVVVGVTTGPGTVFLKPRTHIRAASLDPLAVVNAQDIGHCVTSVQGFHYPFHINCTSRCTDNGQCQSGLCSGSPRKCSAPNTCTIDADCASLQGTHTCSANGYCTNVKDSCSGLCQP
jgi:hypothetical protein